MSDVTELDVRLPMGVMFALLGAVLVVYGAVSDKTIYERSLGVNVNLWWGLVILAFGLSMLFLARRGRKAVVPQGRGFEPVVDESRPPR